ncbi:hypothetical protein LC607_30320 [Nostoc sp. CHAB 5824]|nr:hypothetical protein [Nostoc sp. CHAB 5824]
MAIALLVMRLMWAIALLAIVSNQRCLRRAIRCRPFDDGVMWAIALIQIVVI